MTAVDVLKKDADLSFASLLEAIEGLTQQEAWARVMSPDDDYLHTDGSIQGIVLHVASCKKAYGSIAFRETELRWRDLAVEVEKIEGTWDGARQYLMDAHDYWLATWANLTDQELETERLHFSGKNWPAWKIIQTVIHHDGYHAGQVAVVRFATTGSDIPPPSTAEDIRTYCKDLPSW